MHKIFNSKWFKRISIGIIALAILIVPLITAAQMGGGISVAQYFKRVGNALQPINPAYTICSSGTPCANIFATAATIGTLTISSTVSGDLSVGGVIKNSDGSATAPSITFTNDATTGFYKAPSPANAIGIANNGVAVAKLSPLYFYSPSKIIPLTSGNSFIAGGRVVDGATAIANKLGNTDNALTTAGAKIVSFYSDNVTTERAAIGLTGEMMVGDGTAALPSLSFLSAPNTGFFKTGVNIGVSVGGTSPFTFTASGLISSYFFGAGGQPSNILGQSLDNASAIGVRLGNIPAMTTAGAQIAAFYSDNMTTKKAAIGLNGEVMAGLGTVSLPGLSFLGDPDSGLFSSGAGALDLVVDGTTMLEATSTNLFFNSMRTLTAGNLGIRSTIADGATSIGITMGTTNSMTTAGAKLVSFKNSATEKAAIGLGGELMVGPGTTSLPSYSFLGDPDTGFINTTNNGTTKYQSNGVTTVGFNSAGLNTPTITPITAMALTLQGFPADGASAVGVNIGSYTNFTTAGAKLVSFVNNNTTEKASIDLNGTYGSVLGSASLAAAATSFAAQGNVMTVTCDGGGNTIATITAGVTGERLTLLFVDALCTITDTDAATANTVNLSAAWTSSANDTMTLIFNGTKWFEVARSVN